MNWILKARVYENQQLGAYKIRKDQQFWWLHPPQDEEFTWKIWMNSIFFPWTLIFLFQSPRFSMAFNPDFWPLNPMNPAFFTVTAPVFPVPGQMLRLRPQLRRSPHSPSPCFGWRKDHSWMVIYHGITIIYPERTGIYTWVVCAFSHNWEFSHHIF